MVNIAASWGRVFPAPVGTPLINLNFNILKTSLVIYQEKHVFCLLAGSSRPTDGHTALRGQGGFQQLGSTAGEWKTDQPWLISIQFLVLEITIFN